MRLKQLILFCLMLFTGMRGFAQLIEKDGLLYQLDSSSGRRAKVISLTNTKLTDIVIPTAIIDDVYIYTVNSIGKEVFRNCTSLTSVTFQNASNIEYIEDGAFEGCTSLSNIDIRSAKSIGKKAFYKCTGLTEIDITGATSIGDYAFYGCTSLTGSISFKNSVEIGPYAFYGCTGLTEIDITRATSIGDYAFSGCEKFKTILTVTSCKSLGKFAFENCKSLTEVTISVESTIENSSFKGCSNLEKVEIKGISGRVNSIGGNAFYECTSLKEVILPNSIKTIGQNAFRYCEKLTKIKPYGEIGANAFDGCKSLETVDLSSVTKIEQYAFANCGITTLNIPAIVTEMGTYVFQNCESLTEVKMQFSKLVKISDFTFAGCTNLTSIEFPYLLEEIGKNAFEYCNSLRTVPINNLRSLAKIRECAFKNCEKLTSIIIPQVISIDKQAFINCTDLKKVTFSPSSIEYLSKISESLFENCTSLEEVYIPSTVTIIDPCAFKGCSSLKELKIPNSVTNIYRSAFEDCISLEKMEFPIEFGKGAAIIEDRLFYNCINLTDVVIPDWSSDAVSQIGSQAFYNCKKLKKVNLPARSVRQIKISAFENCSSLEEIVIPDFVTSIDNAAFKGCTGLKKIICRTNNITQFGSNAFDDTSDSPIIVPTSYLDIYKAGWYAYEDRITDKVSITLKEATNGKGYATYCSHADLDFTGVTEDIQAYIIEKYYKSDNSYAVLTPVDKMRYGTGILLIGKPGKHEVTFAKSAINYDETNLLKGTLEEQELLEVDENQKTNFILTDGDSGIGFYKSSTGKIAAHKAYLPLSRDDAEVLMLLIGGNDDTTGMEQSIQETMQQTDAIYNLNGQRVDNPQHGIYIVGGKKVIFK